MSLQPPAIQKIMSRCLSVPDATSYITALRTAKTKMLSVVRSSKWSTKYHAELLGTLGKYLLFTTYLTSTNMPTAQQNKGTNYAQIREAVLYAFRLCNRLTATFK